MPDQLVLPLTDPEPGPPARPVTECCGEPVMDRPFQCLHEWEAFRAAKAALER